MEYGAIDLHLKASQIRIVDADGRGGAGPTVATTRAALTQVFAGRAPLRVLLESGTESEWVAQTVEACGHEVIVADPNYALMYGHRARRIKTDKRDVAALAEACRLGIYRRGASGVGGAAGAAARGPDPGAAGAGADADDQSVAGAAAAGRHPVAGGQRPRRWARGSTALAAAGGAARGARAAADAAHAPWRPLLATSDAQVAAHAAADPVVRRLMTAPGIGPITAVTYRADARHVGAVCRCRGVRRPFSGLCRARTAPARGSGKGAITKAGPGPVRALLVQAAWVVWRQRAGPRGAPRLGRAPRRRGGANASRSSRWRGAWRAFSTRSGGMTTDYQAAPVVAAA